MVQGTSSHAGKTTLVAALCRIFARAGYRVAPFKAQNMSNNAAVTDDGGEVGRAQAMQAMAAGVDAKVDMNPVLLKPQSDQTSQVVVLGKARYTKNAREYYALRGELWPVVAGALDRLRASYDVVVIEGAGSPAEINLAQYDIVNMRVARHAQSPVLLVGDIERGGVFASLYGTVALLSPEDRALIRAFIINKFRGDPSLLDSGFAMMYEMTGVRTIGVLPYLDLSRLPAEDGLDWTTMRGVGGSHADTIIDIAVMRLPRIANLDEFQALASEPGVQVRFVGNAHEFGLPDLVIIPGTKSTLGDLAWLRDRGLADAIVQASRAGCPVLGICGGYQMLGRRIVDSDGVESIGEVDGLGLLPVSTIFAAHKITQRVRARVASTNALWDLRDWDARIGDGSIHDHSAIDAYEIHMGRTEIENGPSGGSPFEIEGGRADGMASADGVVVGTYMHGLLEHVGVRRSMLRRLASRKGKVFASTDLASAESAIDHLANSVGEHLDVNALFTMVGLSAAGAG